MQLDDFISKTLIAIARGVKEAQRDVFTLGGRVSPRLMVSSLESEKTGVASGDAAKQPIIPVSFDVSVTTTANTGTEGGIGVFVGAIGLGTKGSSGSAQGSESRIQFQVPVILPFDK
jgi:hypothetical protein